MMLLTSEEEARAYVAQRCTPERLDRLEQLVHRLALANEFQNLVARSSIGSVWLRHIADSAQLLDHVSRETGPWIDLGSGAGFPGLVVAIMRPSMEVKLIESRNLRIAWLQSAAQAVGLDNCEVVGTDVRKATDIEAGVISARAFAPLDRLIAISARFSTSGTQWVLPKGRSAAQELAALPSAQRSLFHVKQSVTDAESGIVVGTGRVEIAA